MRNYFGLVRHTRSTVRLVFILALSLFLSACGDRIAYNCSGPIVRASKRKHFYPRRPFSRKKGRRGRKHQRFHIGRNGPLTEREMKMARIAWKYFENNYQPETGMVNAVQDYPSTTTWDMGSSLGALVTAEQLQIIDKHTFDDRMITLLKTLNSLDLFNNELPNKAYHTKTAQKVNYANQPGEIGFSGLDIGRLLIWLRIIKDRYPEHANAIDHVVLRWDFRNVLDEYGTIYGAVVDSEKKISYLQEGRLGYEEYAAKGYQLWGFHTARASLPEPFNLIPIEGIHVPYDTRDPRVLNAHNYVVCESYVLDAMELNWDLADDCKSSDLYHSDTTTAAFAQRIYCVQETRYRCCGILTARTEHQLDGPPYFVYDTIYSDGYAWNTITDTGKYVPEYAAVSLKGAMGLWTVWETPYTDLLFDTIVDLNDPEKGFYEGLLENGKGVIKTFTANNNGIMMEALLYKVQGKLMRCRHAKTYWDKIMLDEFDLRKQGYPKEFPERKVKKRKKIKFKSYNKCASSKL